MNLLVQIMSIIQENVSQFQAEMLQTNQDNQAVHDNQQHLFQQDVQLLNDQATQQFNQDQMNNMGGMGF